MRYGVGLLGRYDYQKNETEIIDEYDQEPTQKITSTINLFVAGVSGTIGANYVIKDRFVLGLDFLPSFEYKRKQT